MDRRKFLAAVGGSILLSPAVGRAQHTKVPVVGILNSGWGQSQSVNAVRQALRDLGWIEGQTIVFDIRFAGAKPDAFVGLAAELVRREVDLIYVSGPAGIRAATGATRTIPIVALDLESDPVRAGFARSLAQPGGNIAGCFLDQPGLTGKWLELILEAAPAARRIAVLRDPTTGPWQRDAINSAARTRNIELHVVEILGAENLGEKLEGVLKQRPQGLIQLSSPLFNIARIAKRIADFAVSHRLPSISMFKNFADLGGLLAYGPDQAVFDKCPASYIDKILKGTKPADLPIEQPTKFELIINIKTAKALGLTIPQTLFFQANQVIE